jgi:hypothetical protein
MQNIKSYDRLQLVAVKKLLINNDPIKTLYLIYMIEKHDLLKTTVPKINNDDT